MTLRLQSDAEYNALVHRMKNPETAEPFVSKKSKLNAVICEADRLKFPSKKHRAYYLQLKAEQAAGLIKFFLREVPFDLPGHYENGRVIRHYIDFAVVGMDDRVRFVEVKGRDLGQGKMKRLQVEEIYGIRIEVV